MVRVVLNSCTKSRCEQIRNKEGKPYPSSILCIFHNTHFRKSVSLLPEVTYTWNIHRFLFFKDFNRAWMAETEWGCWKRLYFLFKFVREGCQVFGSISNRVCSCVYICVCIYIQNTFVYAGYMCITYICMYICILYMNICSVCVLTEYNPDSVLEIWMFSYVFLIQLALGRRKWGLSIFF